MKLFYLLLTFTFFTIALQAQSAGDFDPTFGDGGVVMTAIDSDFGMSYDMALQPDGKIILAGKARVGSYKFAMTRYNADGTLDQTFGENGIVTTPSIGVQDHGKAIALQPDGRIILSGYIFDGNNYYAVVARYFDDGDLDPTFGEAGVCHLPTLGNTETVALQDDGKIIVGGHANDNFGLARINTDGTIDTSYGADGYAITETTQYSFVFDLAVQDDGKIVAVGMIGGTTSYSDVFVARYSTDGVLDSSFGTDGLYIKDLGGLADFGTAVDIQADGKIIIGSHKELEDPLEVPVYDATIIKLNSDGTHDNSFGSNGVATIKMVEEANYVSDVATQPDGKIAFTGSVVSSNGTRYHTYVTRLNSNGSLDQTFAEQGIKHINPFETEDYLESVLVDENSNIFVAGYSTSPNGVYNFTAMKILGTSGGITPSVDVIFDNVETTTLDVTLTPNSVCASYYFVIMTTEDVQMWLPMMGPMENLIKSWGIEQTDTYTHNFTDLTPNTDYYVYTLPIGVDGTEAAYDSAYVQTTSAGGTGQANATIELLEITTSSVRMIVTPNNETAEFHDGLMTKEYFQQIGQEAAVDYFKNDNQPLYETDDWTWLSLGSDTTYVAIAICKNGIGEWGEHTMEEFTTLPLSIGNNVNNALIIFPNPNHGQFQIKGNNISGSIVTVFNMTGKQVFSQPLDSDHMSVDISHCKSGMYVIEIMNQGIKTTTKLLIQ